MYRCFGVDVDDAANEDNGSDDDDDDDDDVNDDDVLNIMRNKKKKKLHALEKEICVIVKFFQLSLFFKSSISFISLS